MALFKKNKEKDPEKQRKKIEQMVKKTRLTLLNDEGQWVNYQALDYIEKGMNRYFILVPADTMTPNASNLTVMRQDVNDTKSFETVEEKKAREVLLEYAEKLPDGGKLKAELEALPDAMSAPNSEGMGFMMSDDMQDFS